MDNADDVDFDQLMSQRVPRRKNRRTGRIPSLRLHIREEDVSTEENGPTSEEIESERDYLERGLQSAATDSDTTPSRHEQVIIFLPSSLRFVQACCRKIMAYDMPFIKQNCHSIHNPSSYLCQLLYQRA